jgi:hypothetical protein
MACWFIAIWAVKKTVPCKLAKKRPSWHNTMITQEVRYLRIPSWPMISR